jgi:hypothetical protein
MYTKQQKKEKSYLWKKLSAAKSNNFFILICLFFNRYIFAIDILRDTIFLNYKRTHTIKFWHPDMRRLKVKIFNPSHNDKKESNLLI